MTEDVYAAPTGPKRAPRAGRQLILTIDEQHAVAAALLRDIDRRGADTDEATTLRAVLGRLMIR